jgi:hypothetical protein
MGSYQDKENRRETDKVLRNTLAQRLDAARETVEEVIGRMQDSGRLEQLDKLGRLDRRLHRAADAVRFASYGFSGIFDAAKIDEARLDKLYGFDIALADTVASIQEEVDRLKAVAPEALERDALDPVEERIASFDGKLRERGALLRKV